MCFVSGQVYARQDLPLHIDMGCGKGRMLLEMAKQQPDRNFLGIPIPVLPDSLLVSFSACPNLAGRQIWEFLASVCARSLADAVCTNSIRRSPAKAWRHWSVFVDGQLGMRRRRDP